MNEMTIQSVEKQQNLLAWSQRVAECRSSGLSCKFRANGVAIPK